uniref:IC97/Casc1 N-terminal domain-containing protein n=1 Tax=Anopheles farauti TaxID=69004 RepID=A0A182QD85_9DIPT
MPKQAEADRYADEQERLRGKVALEQKEYNQRRMLLLETMKLFRRLEKAATDHGRQLSDRKEWTDFLSCQTPPNPASPPELRECLFRWTFQQDALEKSSVSWTLVADERSPLTQDPGRKRSTRKDLRQAFRNIGEIYLPSIRAALAVLESIQEEPEPETALVRDEIRKFISDSLDKMTFRIGSNIGRDMDTLNPVMSDFQLEATNVLAMYLWSFRPVPLAPDYNVLMKAIDMVPLQLVLHRPPALDLKDCLIRGMWLQFDHYSNMDPTCTIPRVEPATDLIVEQEAEWNERQDIRRKRLATLRKLREDYESEQRRKQAEAEALEAQKGGPGPGPGPGSRKPTPPKATQSSGKSRKGKPAKQPSVPPEPVPAVITDETEVDIDGEFERQQSDRFWDTLATVAPKSLALRAGYINLREYAVVGGIYSLARFNGLPQPVELRTDFIYTNVPVGLKLTGNGYLARSEGEELIKIELRLPAHCHWWEEPTVCCWERWEDGEQFAQLSPEVQQFHRKYDEIVTHQATLLFAAPEKRSPEARVTGAPVKIVQDFCLMDVPVELRLHYLIREHLLPRVPEAYRFRPELRRLYDVLTERSARRKARERERLARNGMLQKYDQFLTGSHRRQHGASLSEMRLPTDGDIGSRRESDAEERRSTVALQEMDEKLPQFSLAPLDGARYLHPPVPLCRPLIIGQLDGPPTAPYGAELEQEMEALLLRLESRDAMLDNGSDEQLCKLFSTFVLLLEYLREQAKPNFPPVPMLAAVEDTADGTGLPTGRPSKRTRRRQVEIRTTKKYPLGLSGRTRTPSGSSVIAPPVGERRKRKRKKSLDAASRPSHRDRLAIAQEAQNEETPTNEERPPTLISHEPGRWSTKPIRSQSYDPDQRLLTFYTDRLGVYGLAARRYCNIPFLHWDIRRYGRIGNLTAAITIATKALRIVFYTTVHGYRVAVQEQEGNDATPPGVIPTEGAFSLEELEKHLHSINVHVFPQVDTCFYVPDVDAPKHQAMETHNLRCLGAFCLTHQFQFCLWNRYANRRTALVLARQLIEGRHEPEFGTIAITPLKSQHVQVEELCSDTLDEIRLAFHPHPNEQSYNADCYGLLKDGLEEPSRKVLARTPALLQSNVGRLLEKLRLLSYS